MQQDLSGEQRQERKQHCAAGHASMFPTFALVVVNTYFIVLANVRRPWRTPSTRTPQVLVEEDDRRGLLGDVDGRVHRDARRRRRAAPARR